MTKGLLQPQRARLVKYKWQTETKKPKYVLIASDSQAAPDCVVHRGRPEDVGIARSWPKWLRHCEWS